MEERKKVLNETIIRLITSHVPEREACTHAAKLLENALEYVNKKKPGMLADHYGDYLLMTEYDGVQETQDLMKTLREEGVLDDDIRWYYNMDALRNWMFVNTNNTIITIHLMEYENEGLTTDEAAIKLRKTIPIFGDSTIIPNGLRSCDRNLPYPLQKRVELYIAECMEEKPFEFWQNVSKDSTFNAHIRADIQSNKIEKISDYIDENRDVAFKLFRNRIAKHENQLFGIRLYWEVAKVSDYARLIIPLEEESYCSIIQRAEESLARAGELLTYIESYSELTEYLHLFQFPPIYGHPGLEAVTKRVELVVKMYHKLFPDRSREQPLLDEERFLLLQTVDKEWTKLGYYE